MSEIKLAKPVRANKQSMMSSREIAGLTGKDHKIVVRDIKHLLEQLEIYSTKMHYYENKGFFIKMKGYKGREVIDEILLDQDLSTTLVTGYSARDRYKVVKRWRELEFGSTPSRRSPSFLPEYRRARAIKLEVEAIHLALSHLPNLSDIAKQTVMARAVNDATGVALLPLPALEEHYHTASEMGALLGVSAQKIGRIANDKGLKNEQYGKFLLDKSAHSNKQVETFRYNAKGVEALRYLLKPPTLTPHH